MSEPSKDKELKSDTEVDEVKEETHSESNSDEAVKSNSTSGSSPSEEEGKKCMDPMDYMARKAKGIVIDRPKNSETGAGNSTGKAHAGKRRKRAPGGIKRSISLRPGLNERGMTYDSDSEQVPTNAVVVGIKGKAKEDEEETDVYHGSATESEEACKRIKKGRSTDDDSDDSDGAEGGRAGVAHKNLSGGLGFELVTGK